ncbi:MAG: S41 family peptidase [Elusimicrobia bacterium]|nr:S41 family peptidase [Elusimicrobiota bacterium]
MKRLGLLLAILFAPGFLCAQVRAIRLDDLKSVQGVKSPALAPAAAKDGPQAPKSIEGSAVPAPASGSSFETGFNEEELSQIYAISAIIDKFYVDSVDRKELVYGALEGMAKKLDPHSQFFDPKAFKDFQEQLNGSFSGIGAGLKKKEKGEGQGIAYTMPGSPAEKAGLKPGDVIAAVDGEDIRPLSQDDATKKIRGPEGTPVRLSILRTGQDGKASQLEVTVVRGRVQTANAYSKMHPNGVGYVYFESFREDTHLTVMGEVRKLKRQGLRSLILDVRNNGGGSLQSVINLSSAFLKKGMGIVSTKNRKSETRAWQAPAEGEFSGIPVILLVNGYSASASEILAGALQDNKKAVVVGSRTYGKGSAQIVIPFQDGSALKLTVDRWYTPSGRSIQKDNSGGGGVAPDVPVQVEEAAEMKAMSQILRELNRMPPSEPASPDPALAKALELFK